MTFFLWQMTTQSYRSFFENCLITIQTISGVDFIQITPEIYFISTIFVGLIIVGTANFKPSASLITQKKEITSALYKLALMSIFMTFCFYLFQISILFKNPSVTFNGHYITDFYAQSLKLGILFAAWVVLIASQTYMIRHPRHLMEYPILILLTTLFLLFMVSSYNCMAMFLSIIGFSLNVYVLLLYDSFNHTSREAGVKYFYLSTLSAGLILSGIFLGYFVFHNLGFISITWILHQWSFRPNLDLQSMLMSAMVYFLIFGFLFKLAAFPCHLWAPEIYDGSPHPMTAFFVLPIKIASFGFLLRFLSYTLATLYSVWSYMIWMSSFFSMIWGCLGALGEQLLKRFIAYSSINQMGFLLMGLASATFEGLRAALLYLLLYILMNLGFFILFLNTREKKTNRALTFLSDFNDYAQKHYLYSITLVIILFSMAGIPPLGGFFGKFFLFLHSFEMSHFVLVIVGMITSLIATYYYLRIIKIMLFEKPFFGRFQFQTFFTETLFAIYIVFEFVLVWFFIWSPWLFPYLNMMTTACINPLTTFYQND